MRYRFANTEYSVFVDYLQKETRHPYVNEDRQKDIVRLVYVKSDSVRKKCCNVYFFSR